MVTSKNASVLPAPILNTHTLCLALPPGDDTEAISLMFEILGWQQTDRELARLRLDPGAGVVHVSTTDPDLAHNLARAGLDRLTLPVVLPALEQLMVVAG
jgi:hypothetical protein